MSPSAEEPAEVRVSVTPARPESPDVLPGVPEFARAISACALLSISTEVGCGMYQGEAEGTYVVRLHGGELERIKVQVASFAKSYEQDSALVCEKVNEGDADALPCAEVVGAFTLEQREEIVQALREQGLGGATFHQRGFFVQNIPTWDGKSPDEFKVAVAQACPASPPLITHYRVHILA
jgi:hypothetical protein